MSTQSRLLFLLFLLSIMLSCKQETSVPPSQRTTIQDVRFATYNVSFYRDKPGQLKKDLSSKQDTQIQNVAAVIQHVRPDVIVLCEFDYDSTGTLLDLFQNNYLSHPQHGEKSINYPYRVAFPSNTGMLSPVDISGDGQIQLPDDAYGYGRYPGQYAFAMLSKYPIREKDMMSYQNFLWSKMPGAQVVRDVNGENYYSDEAWNAMRLSSKNHVAVPIQFLDNQVIYAIIAHPTPPVFDGPEDRNGLRNYDEIRLLKDMISDASYLESDQGIKGGVREGTSFVVMGDLNADPIDGDSAPNAIGQLLNHPSVNPDAATGKFTPTSSGGKSNNQRPGDKADPKYDTAFFGARIDYVLPSKDLPVYGSGVFWPAPGEPLYDQVKNKKASDHLLVWVDLKTR